MKTLCFDSVGGASGDMILATLIDLGVEADTLRSQLSSLPVEQFELIVSRDTTSGFAGTRVNVAVREEAHVHRCLRHIREMLGAAVLPKRARELALAVFAKLAEAEAAVHGTTAEEVHFHEVGAVDSIVDIVGACCALCELGVDAVRVSPLPLGSGTVECAHGTMPVPAPATARLLDGQPVVRTDEQTELVTPTGAALLTTWKELMPSNESGETGTVSATGTGLGTRKLRSRPNMLRAMLMEREPAGDTTPDTCLVLECNLDDTVPELLGALTERLLAAGALDVFMAAIFMKKQRPGTRLTVLCEESKRELLLDAIFRGCTTFGVRAYKVDRTTLARRHESVETSRGPVRVKIGTWQGEDITWAPEYEDCAALAGEQNVSVRQVYEAAVGAAHAMKA